MSTDITVSSVTDPSRREIESARNYRDLYQKVSSRFNLQPGTGVMILVHDDFEGIMSLPNEGDWGHAPRDVFFTTVMMDEDSPRPRQGYFIVPQRPYAHTSAATGGRRRRRAASAYNSGY